MRPEALTAHLYRMEVLDVTKEKPGLEGRVFIPETRYPQPV